jgi:hypothetical protein
VKGEMSTAIGRPRLVVAWPPRLDTMKKATITVGKESEDDERAKLLAGSAAPAKASGLLPFPSGMKKGLRPTIYRAIHNAHRWS